jgi:hypothetical protein
MIYEFRTYDLKHGATAEVEKRFAESYEHRKKFSELAAFWHTEIGPLNQIIHVWPYKDLEERSRIRAAAVKENVWPPAIGEFIVNMRSEIMIPAPFSPLITPGKMGPYFEIRTYTYPMGALPGIMENWEKALPNRVKLSPLCLVCYSELGGLNKWVHIWPYATLDQRNQVRNQAKALGVWPPSVLAAKEGRKSTPFLVQENKIVMPAAFSPVQ